MLERSRTYLLCISSVTALLAVDMLTTTAWSQETLDEIVVTARKRSESFAEVPESITVFTADAVEDANIVYFQDFAAQTPNLSFNTTFEPGQINLSIRGLITAQNAEVPVAMIVDGVQVSDPSFMNQELVDIEQIEVLRGPQGSLYGRNAIGGAINITTKKPTEDVSGRLSAGYGSGNDLRLSGAVSGPLKEGSAYYTAAVSYRNFDGLIEEGPTSLNRDEADPYEEITARLGLQMLLSDQLEFNLRFNYIDTEAGSLSSEIVSRAGFDSAYGSSLSRSTALTASRDLIEVSAKFDYETSFGTFTSVTGYSDVDNFIFGEADFSNAPFLLQNIPREIKAINQEFRLTSNQDSSFDWLVGVFYQDRDIFNGLVIPYDDGMGAIAAGLPLVSTLDDQTSESTAIFGQLDFDLSDKLELSVGLRYDEDKRSVRSVIGPTFVVFVPVTTPQVIVEESADFDALQGKLSVSYDWTDGLQTYATFAQGFRSGGFNGGGLVFEDENVDSYELGFKSELSDGRILFTGSVFRIESEDAQIFFPVGNPPTQVVTNYNDTTINGVELELIGRFGGLSVNAGLGVLDATIDDFNGTGLNDGNTVVQVPETDFNLGLQYEWSVFNDAVLLIRSDYNRRGEVYWDAGNTLLVPEKDFVNVRIALELENLTLSAYGNNILDERFPLQAGADTFGPDANIRIPSPEGFYGVRVDYRF